MSEPIYPYERPLPDPDNPIVLDLPPDVTDTVGIPRLRRKLRRKLLLRRLCLCSWRGCDWDEPNVIEVGPIGETDDGEWYSMVDAGEVEPYVLGSFKQCNRCWRCVDV